MNAIEQTQSRIAELNAKLCKAVQSGNDQMIDHLADLVLNAEQHLRMLQRFAKAASV